MGHLYIRADATVKIGTGHIMRCISLAQTWKARGGKVTFISYCDNDLIKQKIQSHGFAMLPLDAVYPAPVDLKTTRQTIKAGLPDQGPGNRHPKNWIILDGYNFPPEYQKSLVKTGHNVLVIDDNHHLPWYHATIILNQNLSTQQLKYACNKETSVLLGERYALLRKEFLTRQPDRQIIPKKARNLLVTMGGADHENLSLTVIQSLKTISHLGLKTKIIMGPANPHIRQLERLNLSPDRITIIRDGNMTDLMQWADMAVTAGGSTCLELSYMGVPSIVIITADNQIKPVSALEAQKTIINLGRFQTLEAKKLSQTIATLAVDKKKRKRLISKAQTLIDGKGTKRIIREMVAGPITLRSAAKEDAKNVWVLANDPMIREFSFSSAPIPWPSHLAWFQERLSDPDTFLFIAENKAKNLVGQIRFEKKDHLYSVSYSLAEDFRGLGLGTCLLKMGIEQLVKHIHVGFIVQGEVKPGNIPSQKSFEHCHFKRIADHSKLVYQVTLDAKNEPPKPK